MNAMLEARIVVAKIQGWMFLAPRFACRAMAGTVLLQGSEPKVVI
jgi:hypothetical protein